MQRTNARFTANQVTTPLRVISDIVPQFQILNGSSVFNISVGSTGTVMSGTSLAIQSADIGDAHIGRIRQQRQITTYTAITTSQTIAPLDMYNIVILTTSPAAIDPFTLVLPTASALISSLTMVKDDIITFDVINETASRANLTVAGAPTDTIQPLNDMGDVPINAHTSASVTVHLVSTVPPIAQYFVTANTGLVVVPTSGSLPVIGTSTSTYCAADTNITYRYGTITTNYYDWTVGAGGDFATLPLAIASPLVVSGQALCLLDGTYNLAAQLVISKSLTIFGQSRTGTILRCLAATEIVNLISVTAASVVLCNMTIGHYKTTNVATDTAVELPGAGVAGFIMDNCTCIYGETAVSVQSSLGWKINNCTFTYAGPINGANFSTITIKKTADNSFITNNIFDNTALVTGTARAILATTGTIEGMIFIEDNTNLGLLQQLMNVVTFSGADNNLSICAKRNVVTETDAFITLTSGIANFGDKLLQVVAQNNTLTNAHEHGIFAVTGGGAGVVFRIGGNLPLHASGNTLGIETISAGWAAATGSTHATCNYNTTSIAAVVVTQDAVIPATPVAPVTPTESATAAQYTPIAVPRYTKETFLVGTHTDYYDLANLAVPSSITAFVNRGAINESVDYTLSVSPMVTRMIWIGDIAVGGPEALIAGDRISVQYVIA